MRSGQLDEAVELVNSVAVTHTVVAASVVFFFWNATASGYLIVLFLLVMLPLMVAVAGARFYARQDGSAELVDLGHRVATGLALMLGLAWSTMPLALFVRSDSDHRMLVVAICAGLVASAFTLGPIRSISLLFTTPIVAGSLGALLWTGETIGKILAVVLMVYGAFVLVTVRRLTRLSTQRILDQLRVREQNETIGLLLHEFEANTSDWLWETDADGALQHVSERMAQVSGRSVDALIRAPFETLFLGNAGLGHPGQGRLAGGIAELLQLLKERTAFRDQVVEVAPSESARWWRFSGKPTFDRLGQFVGFRGVGSDITDTKHAEARIAHLASYDALTNLANRRLFQDQAAAACERAARTRSPCSLLYLDLDGFKIVNDTFGHGLGDLLLQRVAGRLRSAISAGDVVARLGGDEFAILHECGGQAEAMALAQALIAAVSAPYTIDTVQVEIGVSIGIAMAPADAEDLAGLLGKADLALYRAKAEGKGTACLFEPDLEASVRTRRELEADLKTAVAKGEFALNYQPLVSLTDGRIHSFEALLRWVQPVHGPISPADFVPVAEACGLISVIGRWVLVQACAEAARWPRHIRLAVNISPTQFRNSDLVEDVVAALEGSGLDPDRLEIEVTESVFFEMNAVAVANLGGLRALGIRIALDDFGTGYSSLSYLIKFPVDKIKIDRSFINDMTARHECRAIVEAILTLAKKLSITVTAEGVELVEQALMLREVGCDDIQGFLFSRGCAGGAVESLIAAMPARFAAIFPPDSYAAA